MPTRRNVRYTPLPAEDKDNESVTEENSPDLQFAYAPKSYRKIPWKSIALALFLLLLGISLLSLSYFISTGHIGGDSSHAYALVPGCPCFPSWLLRDSSCLLFMERSTRVHLCVYPRLLGLHFSTSEGRKHKMQKPKALNHGTEIK